MASEISVEQAEAIGRCLVPVFEANGWTYGSGLGAGGHVPTSKELTQTVLDDIDEAHRRIYGTPCTKDGGS